MMGHAHGPGHGHGRAHRGRLKIAFLLTASFFLVELVVGFVSGSLALQGDAGHMAADVVALGAALVATWLAPRPDSSGRRTYGFYRAEIFAAGGAAVLMLGTAAYIGVEALHRIGASSVPASQGMLVVGALGLVVNAVSIVVLRDGAKDSLNVRGAYLEVLSDAVGSVGVIVAGVLVQVTGQGVWDVAVAVGIALFITMRAMVLGREVLGVLAQHAPHGTDVQQVTTSLRDLPGVADVHDVHIWTLTSGMPVATSHLVLRDPVGSHAVLDQARDLLDRDFGIQHATLQVEPSSHTGCDELTW